MEFTYTSEVPHPDQLYDLYECEGWNDFLKLPKEVLHQAMVQSWCVMSAYHENRLIGTGRIISDGLINGYICGVIVHPSYRNQAIGKEIMRKLVEQGRKSNLYLQLFSEEKNISYYESIDFEEFAVGFKYKG